MYPKISEINIEINELNNIVEKILQKPVKEFILNFLQKKYNLNIPKTTSKPLIAKKVLDIYTDKNEMKNLIDDLKAEIIQQIQLIKD